MKLRDHRTGFDITMNAMRRGDGSLELLLSYEVPGMTALMQLSSGDAHDLGLWLLEKFPERGETAEVGNTANITINNPIRGDALHRADAELRVHEAVQSGRHASKGAARRAMGIETPEEHSDEPMPEWARKIAEGHADQRPVINNVTVVRPRRWWRFWGKR